MKFTIIAAIIGFSIFGYYHLKQNYWVYPKEMTLMNSADEELSIRLVGRDRSSINFARVEDSEVYSYPIKELSQFSQWKVRLFPLNAKPRTRVETGSKTTAEMHREGLVKSLNELRINLDLKTRGLNAQKNRTDYKKVKSEIFDLKKEISQKDYELKAFDIRQDAPDRQGQ